MLNELATEQKAWMIGLTETHLTEEVLDGEIEIKGYQTFRVDRTRGIRGGGVILYVRHDVAVECGFVQGKSLGFVEYISCYVKSINTVIILIYRPDGHSSQFIDALEKLDSYIDGFGVPTPNVIVLGDFNFPGMDWIKMDLARTPRAADETLQVTRFVTFMEEHCLVQLVRDPTRAANILDLVLTNNEDLIHDCRVEDSSLTDHRLVFVETTFQFRDQQSHFNRKGLNGLNFMDSRIEWSSLCSELERVTWSEILCGRTPEDMFQIIVDTLEYICKRFVPRRKVSHKYKIPRDRKILMRRRNAQTKRLGRTAVSEERRKLSRDILAIEREIAESIKKELEREEERAVRVIKDNPKYFFTYTRNKGQIKRGVGPLEVDGDLLGEPEKMVEILQDHYCGTFSTPKFNELEEIKQIGVTSSGEMCDMEFSIEDIKKVMSELSSSASPGPDGVPSILLRNCRHSLAEALYLLWKESIRLGRIPTKLKEATITPIYKGEGRGSAGNYRPVSLTSHIIKVFEKVVAERIVSYLEREGKMNPNQHGFRRNRSCLSQLVQHHYCALRMVEENKCADVIYLDFSKAFDKVDHGVLLSKLSAVGIRGRIFRWIYEFLVGRTQRVAVSGSESRSEVVRSGVPQGTVLGPILFLIHVADIDDEVQWSRVSSFADDTRILKSVGGIEDHLQLQSDLEQIYRWAVVNNMIFNATKFEHIRYSVGEMDIMRGVEYSAPGDVEIERKEEVRDLGVMLSDDLKFSSHIGRVVRNARRKLGWVLRTFHTRRKDHMMVLYKSLVLPHLEYCCQLWSPRKIGEISWRQCRAHSHFELME